MRRLRASVIVIVIAAAAGCGSSSSGGSGATTTNATGARSFAAFTSCLKQHGVKSLGAGLSGGQPPSGAPPSGGTPPQLSAKMQKAIAACQQYAPQGGQGGGFGAPPGS
jgi:hypothetical protein